MRILPTIKIAHGSISKVVSPCFNIISKDLALHSVIYVPRLACNLLSVSVLTNLSFNACESQDLSSRGTIGSAEVCSVCLFLELIGPLLKDKLT